MSAVDEIAAYLVHLKTSGNRIDQIIFDELPNGEGMTATNELRRLLDERGVEHMDFNMPERSLTLFAGDEHDGSYAENSVDTILTVYGASPEQAVEATLGRGTCNADETDTWECVRDDLGGYGKTLTVHVMECTECGHTYEHVNGSYEFCPRCGRKVVGA